MLQQNDLENTEVFIDTKAFCEYFTLEIDQTSIKT
jgi:hypothetical protein